MKRCILESNVQDTCSLSYWEYISHFMNYQLLSIKSSFFLFILLFDFLNSKYQYNLTLCSASEITNQICLVSIHQIPPLKSVFQRLISIALNVFFFSILPMRSRSQQDLNYSLSVLKQYVFTSLGCTYQKRCQSQQQAHRLKCMYRASST